MLSAKLNILSAVLLSSFTLALPVGLSSSSNTLTQKSSIPQNSNSNSNLIQKRAPVPLTLSYDHRCIPDFDLSRVLISSSFNSKSTQIPIFQRFQSI